MAAGAAAGGAAAAAAIANAIKASGVCVRVGNNDFQTLLRRVDKPLVVYSEGGLFKKSFWYVMSYRGLAFYTKSHAPLLLPSGVETIVAEKIWMPQ